MSDEEFESITDGTGAEVPQWHDDPAPEHDGPDYPEHDRPDYQAHPWHDGGDTIGAGVSEPADFGDDPHRAPDSFGTAADSFQGHPFDEPAAHPGSAFDEVETPAEHGLSGTASDDVVESFTVFSQSESATGWAHAIGAGAADPAGTHYTAFEQLDLQSAAGEADAGLDLDWISSSAVDRQNWVQPALLGATQEQSQPADALNFRTPQESISSLWQRLSPGLAMPQTDSGDPDLPAALDAIAAGHGGASMQDVVRIARRLLSG